MGFVAEFITVDGNEATARVAYALSEVIAIYPITPASPMGESADSWAHQRRANLWGVVPDVLEMQSEAGAAGAVHGSLQAGALTTTFTASQGLLLMLPNMFKIAGELTPTVFHVAARAVATHALSIFGDHSDVMAARSTGFALLSSASVQEAQDLAVIAHSTTLRARVPILHFFDGFRTSHEVSKIRAISDRELREMIPDDLIGQHRLRALHPTRPVLRGSAQNPDVFFQAREAVNPYYRAVPRILSEEMDRFANVTGRRYHPFEYFGHPEAEKALVLMGSGSGSAQEAVQALVDGGEPVGVVTVRLFRPFDAEMFRTVLPESVRSLAVLDRTKEPGAVGEPLYTEVIAALTEQAAAGNGAAPRIYGGRYGLSSKEFTPSMVLRVFSELDESAPRNHFTVGIVDDVTHTSIPQPKQPWQEPEYVARAVFYGLGSDGTVGANKSSAKIVGDNTDLWAQGYFVYDSKKAGSQTVSHLRFSPEPIRSTYLIEEANFVACHQWDLIESVDVTSAAARGATLLINCPHAPDQVWDQLSPRTRRGVIEKGLDLWVVDANRIARENGLGGRINTIMQTCFFALTELLPTSDAIDAVKAEVEASYGKRGEVVVRRNHTAIDRALGALTRVDIPDAIGSEDRIPAIRYADAPDFVRNVTATMLDGRGDELPVSALPVDGTFPTGTAKWEKRSIATEIPVWDPELCIDCARCAIACPHAAIRLKMFDAAVLEQAPFGFKSKDAIGKEYEGSKLTVQVAPDDCTGCGVCVDVCPARSKEIARHKAIDMSPKLQRLEHERSWFDFFVGIPEADRSSIKFDTVKGSQLLQPLFEFSGACAGCGETPYLKLLSQMFGDRAIIANATGCSSIYGGNLPTTPWTKDDRGFGPAWSNSLFEDNAEFGLGIRLGLDAMREEAEMLVAELRSQLGGLAGEILSADQSEHSGVDAQRQRVERLKNSLASMESASARRLEALADTLIRTEIWIVGGDGWAYDIGFGGLDHVLASGRDVNILVLDTEVYSNTGGQASKATPRAAIAKFAAGGKTTAKKDLGQIAMSYGNVYVAQVAMGANMSQVVKAFAEAEAHTGVSLIIAYSPCIAHGIDMSTQMSHQKEAAESGYWPLYRYDPARETAGEPGLKLDSRKPSIPFATFAEKEARFAMLHLANPARADELLKAAQEDIDNRWHLYEQMVHVHRTAEYTEIDEHD